MLTRNRALLEWSAIASLAIWVIVNLVLLVLLLTGRM